MFDIGTTYSGAVYAFLDPDEVHHCVPSSSASPLPTRFCPHRRPPPLFYVATPLECHHILTAPSNFRLPLVSVTLPGLRLIYPFNSSPMSVAHSAFWITFAATIFTVADWCSILKPVGTRVVAPVGTSEPQRLGSQNSWASECIYDFAAESKSPSQFDVKRVGQRLKGIVV